MKTSDLWRLTGGRPMTCLEYAFTDVVNGRGVWLWCDRLGREWLAHGSWSAFRVRAS